MDDIESFSTDELFEELLIRDVRAANTLRNNRIKLELFMEYIDDFSFIELKDMFENKSKAKAGPNQIELGL